MIVCDEHIGYCMAYFDKKSLSKVPDPSATKTYDKALQNVNVNNTELVENDEHSDKFDELLNVTIRKQHSVIPKLCNHQYEHGEKYNKCKICEKFFN